ncbi:GNAT family N-acetyltransferase [Flavihumibacter petaseus]|uniref:Putative acetyltransferase n=1 Tax=Flavihumibacter petaseus NBRC 106054 TaxID=1220578 RepID=A0A0E9MXL8_9BACT|nr:GNAT family N-acetyltransferase [Flavihumibacter petaseus]GAO42253.1 putative acetyltransferase [Flavihumibacter petaseus NBRC 106054]
MITIRLAEVEDAPAAAYLFDQYRQFYYQKSNLQGATDFLTDRLKAKESALLIAVEEGELKGFCQLYPIFSSVSMRRAWLLNDLFVAEASRGKGIASRLLDAAVSMATDQGAGWLLLQTAPDNIPAQALYEKKGWLKENDLFYRFDIK